MISNQLGGGRTGDGESSIEPTPVNGAVTAPLTPTSVLNLERSIRFLSRGENDDVR